MSSDSDSDVCDFTSDINKHLTKGLKQFWQNYNNSKIAEDVNDNLDQNIVSISDSNVIPASPVNLPSVDVGTSKQLNVEEKDENIQSIDTNIHSRIINKLNTLSDEIRIMLSDENKKRKKPTKRKPPAKRGGFRRSNRITNAALSAIPTSSMNPIIIPSDVRFSNDQEVSTATITIEEDEELNPVVSVSVLWKSVEKNIFKVHKYQALSCILEHYSEKYNVNPKLLFFTLDDKYIKLDENSFVSLRLNKGQIIDGGDLPETYLNNFEEFINYPSKELLHFKVQFKDRRNKTISVGCQKDDKMEIIFWEISKNIQEPVENIRLSFDGSVIKPSSKICEMDLEEGDCFDVEITNSQ